MLAEQGEPSDDELDKAIDRLPGGKAVGFDGISGELLKAGGDAVKRHYRGLVRAIWRIRRCQS